MLIGNDLLVGRFHASKAALTFSQISPVPAQAKESSAWCSHLQVLDPQG